MTDTEKQLRHNRRWAVLVGLGIALAPIHNRWLTELVTENGEVGFFIPAFGTAIWLMGSLVFVVWNWERILEVGLGDKRVWIPLLLIVGAIGLSGAMAGTLTDKVAPVLMGVSLFSLYIVARVLGKGMFLPLAIGAGLASLGVIVSSILDPGMLTGGLLFGWNYDIVVGFVLLGATLFTARWRLPLISLSLVAMFLSGSPEAVFSVMVVGVLVISRRDWSKRLLLVLTPVALVAVIWFGLGYGQHLYSYTIDVIKNKPSIPPTTGNREAIPEEGILITPSPYLPERGAIEQRIYVIGMVMADLKPLGEGYNLTGFGKVKNVHNVPLVIVQQLGYSGILAGVAWLWVSIWCLVKTRWKYAWVLVLSLSVFDHYIWTQLAPIWWAVIGVSTTSLAESDLIFKGDRKVGKT